MNKEMSFLPIIEKVKMVSTHNLQPLTHDDAKTLKASLQRPSQIIKRLEAGKFIQPVKITNYTGQLKRHEAFYSIKPITITSGLGGPEGGLRHRSALSDVLAHLIWLYPDYEVEIKHSPQFKVKGHLYIPDALVKLIGLNGKEFVFLVELERSRSVNAVASEKFAKSQMFKSFSEIGLPDATKILYVYADKNYYVYWRPIEYAEPRVQASILAQDRGFAELIKLAANLPNHKYRFLPFHMFNQLDQAVWLMPDANRTSLIPPMAG